MPPGRRGARRGPPGRRRPGRCRARSAKATLVAVGTRGGVEVGRRGAVVAEEHHAASAADGSSQLTTPGSRAATTKRYEPSPPSSACSPVRLVWRLAYSNDSSQRSRKGLDALVVAARRPGAHQQRLVGLELEDAVGRPPTGHTAGGAGESLVEGRSRSPVARRPCARPPGGQTRGERRSTATRQRAAMSSSAISGRAWPSWPTRSMWISPGSASSPLAVDLADEELRRVGRAVEPVAVRERR